MSKTKLLLTSSFFVIIAGFGLVFFGLNYVSEKKLLTNYTQNVVQKSPSATISNNTQVAIDEMESSDPANPEVEGVEEKTFNVLDVVDGDTIKIDGGVTVRLIGIDTPETKDPRKPVQCFGKEASNMAKDLLLGKRIILEKDVSETDKYRRLLRYIFLPLEDGNTLFVNDYMVREGFARVMTYPPDVKYNEQLREAEQDAKKNSRGLWGRC